MNPLGNILGGIIEGTLSGVLNGGKVDPGKIATEVTRQVVTNPVLINQMNAEPPIQSRVVVGTTVGMIGAFFVAGDHLWSMWQSGNVDVAVATAELATLWGLGFALYGRLKNGLKPLFSK